MDPVPQGAPSLQELRGLHPRGAQRPRAMLQGCGAGPQGSFCAKMLLETLLVAGWRHHLRAQLYWDFQLLDSDGDGRLPARDAELLLQEVPGTSASGQAWHNFLREHRPGLAWQDIEAWLSAAPQPHPELAWASGQRRRVEPETGCPGGTGAGTEDSSLLWPWAMRRHWQVLDGIWDSEPVPVASWREALARPRLVAGQRAVPSWTGAAEALWSGAAQARLAGLQPPQDQARACPRQPLLCCAPEEVAAAGGPLGEAARQAAAPTAGRCSLGMFLRRDLVTEKCKSLRSPELSAQHRNC
ncbi:uncharacterized protein LOC135980919 [Chrysemys picta bellii]|uniref:uncharacterized protein LOC135980919 n=1 Tax=Chrysemys picta bellii TaxID=8478 RepID=UPI0032B2C61E